MAINWEDIYKTQYGSADSVQGFNNLGGLNLPSNYNFRTDENNGMAEKLATINLGELQNTRGSNYYTGATTPFGKVGDYFNDLGFTSAGMKGVGSLIGGLGGLAQGRASLKNARLARDAYNTQKDQWQQNYESQRTAVNNQIANQNAWKQAQGRTDYGSYVGGKPSGTNYVG